MATAQKPRHRRKKVSPQVEDDERPASSLSQGWTGEDGEDIPMNPIPIRGPSPQPSITLSAGDNVSMKKAGSFVSVKEAAEEDKALNVDQVEDELKDIKDDDNQPNTEPGRSLLSANGRWSTEPPEHPASSSSGRHSADPGKKVPSNVVVPFDGDIVPGKPEPTEAWSESSMVDLKKASSQTNLRPQTASSQQGHKERTRSPGQGAHTGSVPSMHTVISIEEAKPEDRINEYGEGTSGAVTGERNQHDTKSLVSTTSIVRIPPPQLEKEQQAYVPFLYARDSLEKMMGDMKKMKVNHIKIVSDIQDAYRAIENETQAQFNVFVVGLRTDYRGKVKTFRQVIEVHREELTNHQTYWQDTLQSLSQRNKELLKEKRKLLLINKMEIERLEKEKAAVITNLTSKMDAEHNQLTSTAKDRDNMLDAHMAELKRMEEGHQGEKKILEDQLTSEKEEKLRLQQMLESQPRETLVESEDTGAGNAPAFAVLAATSGISQEEKTRLEEEKMRLEAERNRFRQEKEQYQEKMIESQKEAAMHQARFNTLHLQYLAIAQATEQNKDKIDEGIVAVEKDKKIMDDEQQELKDDIKKWEEEFKERTGKEPTEEDKPDSVHEIQTQLHEVELKQKELEGKKETLTMLKEGKIPEVKEADIPEPIVKTVEVTVPDPVTVAALAASQAKIRDLEEQLRTLAKTVEGKEVKIEKLEKERKNQKISGGGNNKVDPNLKIVLQAVIKHIQLIHQDDKAAKNLVSARLIEAEQEKAGHVAVKTDLEAQIDTWEKAYRSEHDDGPTEADRDDTAKKLYATLETSKQKYTESDVDITALTMIQTGVIPERFGGMVAVSFSGGGASQEELDELNEKNAELEEEIEEMKKKMEELQKASDQSGGGVSLAVTSGIDVDDDDVEGFNAQLGDMQQQVDRADKELQQEQEAHEKTRDELDDLKAELERLKQEQQDMETEYDGKMKAATAALAAELELKNKSLGESKQRIDELEKEKLSALPPDAAKEIQVLQAKLAKSDKEKEELQKSSIGGNAEVENIKLEMATLSQTLAKEREINRGHQENLKKKMAEKDKQMKEQQIAIEKKYQQREDENKRQLKSLEKKVKELSAGGAVKAGAKGGKGAGAGAVDAKTEKKLKLLQDQIATLKKKGQEDQAKIKELTDQLKEAKSGAFGDKQAGKKQEKALKDLEKKLEMETKKFERESKRATELEVELKTTKKELDTSSEEVKKMTVQITALGVAAQEGVELKEKADTLEKEVKELQAENKQLTENFNSERVLRKKYYNMVEDMKGKIRVYCRARPLSGSEKHRGCNVIVNAPDEYTVSVKSSRGMKEFQFDHVFMAENTQEDVFEDTNNLVQSAVDGYNVCIFAYGQTGSGKTFTMIGDREQNFPGIAPRAFQKIFDVVAENKSKFSFKIYTYMLELYNDKLIDLYVERGKESKLDIKKDKKGMVVVNGSVMLEATNHKELYGMFEQGSANRHVAATKMNAESSRSHLILAIIIESTNITTGTVVKGKLSLVDLAGSERAAKTDAAAEQLKEANSINKSLSALGDVISALSSEQSFIPYRNNKLTLLMQDSLGGNAKTLMFVNVSPADYNADETVISLMYASRVKLITNDATKNADNKEIARLKDVITKLQNGEKVEDEDS